MLNFFPMKYFLGENIFIINSIKFMDFFMHTFMYDENILISYTEKTKLFLNTKKIWENCKSDVICYRKRKN